MTALVFKSAVEYFALRLGDLAATSPGTIEVYRWRSIPRGWVRVGDERAQIETAPLVHHGRQLLTPRGLVVNITAVLKLDGVTPIEGVLLDRYGARDTLRIFGSPFAVDRTAPTAEELKAEQDARQARAEEAERVSDAHDKREGEGWKR